jgi:hypothetical protein
MVPSAWQTPRRRPDSTSAALGTGHELPPSREPPPSREIATQVDSSAGPEEASQASTDDIVRGLRETLARVRRRCEHLEGRLDGEGSVLLAAFKKQASQVARASALQAKLASRARASREGLVIRLERESRGALLRRVWGVWRQALSAAQHLRAALDAQRAELVARCEPAQPSGAPASPPALPLVPQALERKELYNFSYEALIDRILQLQRTLRDVADAADASNPAVLEAAGSVGQPPRAWDDV